MPKKVQHNLIEVVALSILAVICGADTWESIEEYGKTKHLWLKTFLELPNGIPSHDTISRIFSLIKGDLFENCFMAWMQSVAERTSGEIIAIDGKALRGSRTLEKSTLHLVSAWSTSNRLILAQRKVDDKSNEITAIPELLALLDLHGCIVTMDAMGTQKKIADQIIVQGGDFVLALKGNHENLHEDVKLAFGGASKESLNTRMDDFFETVDAEHGRIETRSYWLGSDLSMLALGKDWTGFRSLGIVESQVEHNGNLTIERRYYLTSLLNNAKEFGRAVRSHWGIENGLHWVLDVTFREDHSRIREMNAAQNFAVLRRIALNLLNKTQVKRLSVKTKRLKAGWDNNFALKLLCSDQSPI